MSSFDSDRPNQEDISYAAPPEESLGRSVDPRLESDTISVIRESQLFDTQHYRAQLVTQESQETADLIAHYVECGEQMGLTPHPLFDPRLYRLFNMTPEEEDRQNALAHYLRGAWRGRGMTSVAFDSAWYLDTYQDIRDSGTNPLMHYTQWGISEQRHPCRWLNTVWYRELNPQLSLEQDPAEHFVREFRLDWSNLGILNENELLDCMQKVAEAWNVLIGSPLFDDHFYRTQCSVEQHGGRGHLLLHYLTTGEREGLSPHPLFYPDLYRSFNMSATENRDSALAHYLSNRWKGRGITSPLFDSRWYLEQYADITQAAINPLQHYIEHGWAERRVTAAWLDLSQFRARIHDPYIDEGGPGPEFVRRILGGFILPEVAYEDDLVAKVASLFALRARIHASSVFDAAFYQEQLLSAQAGEIGDPLWHFIFRGDRDDVMPHPFFSPSYYRKHNMTGVEHHENSLDHYLSGSWHGAGCTSAVFDSRWYLERYPDARSAGVQPLVHYCKWGAAQQRPTSAWMLSPRERGLQQPSQERATALPTVALSPLIPTCVAQELAAFLRYADLRIGSEELPSLKRALKRSLAQCPALSGPRGPTPRVSVVVPVFNNLRYTLQCLEAVSRARTCVTFEIIIVDDASTDETRDCLAALPQVRVVTQGINQGFSRACNAGAQEARGEYLLFLNNDTHVLDDWMDELVVTIEVNRRTAMVGSQLIYPNGVLQEGGGIILRDGSAFNYGVGGDPHAPEYSYRRSVDYCSAASLMVVRAYFEELGGFDEEFSPAYAEDVDLAFRARSRGYDVLYQPYSKVIHFQGATCGRESSEGFKSWQDSNLKKLRERWTEKLTLHGVPGCDLNRERDRGACGRILLVDACFPTPDRDAGSLVTDAWLRTLLQLGYHVTFVAVDQFVRDTSHVERFQRLGVCCPVPPFESSAYNFVLQHAHEFDHIVVNRHACAAVVYDALKRVGLQIPCLFIPIDLHYVREEREAEIEGLLERKISSIKTKYRELKAVAQSDLVCVHSTFERDLLQKELPSVPVCIVPIAVPIHGSAAEYEQREHLCFIGGFRHRPNVDAVQFFVKEIWPLVSQQLPGVRFKIIGADTPKEVHALASDTVEVLGFVEDLALLLAAVRLTVAPLRYGAGIKGKVCLSMAAGVPVVGTPLAFEGMDLEVGREVIAASGPTDIARQIVRVYTDRCVWAALSEAGFEHARREFSFEANIPKVQACLAALSKARSLSDSSVTT